MKNKELYDQLETFIGEGVLVGAGEYALFGCPRCRELAIAAYIANDEAVVYSGSPLCAGSQFQDRGVLPCMHCGHGVTYQAVAHNRPPIDYCASPHASTILRILQRNEPFWKICPNGRVETYP